MKLKFKDRRMSRFYPMDGIKVDKGFYSVFVVFLNGFIKKRRKHQREKKKAREIVKKLDD